MPPLPISSRSRYREARMRSCMRSLHQPVAEAARGEQMAGMLRVGFEFATQAVDELFDVLVPHRSLILGPDELGQVMPADDGAAGVVERQERVVLLCRQRHHLAAHPHFGGAAVE